MARKAWADLSPAYRSRLERAGITAQQHASGTPLSTARGHGYDREYNQFLTRQQFFYGRSRADVAGALIGIPKREVVEAVRLQTEAERLYGMGLSEQARALWLTRNQDLPDWMYFYHSFFA